MSHDKHRHAYLNEDLSPLSAINTTPLVDVMLVLLIVFLITIPVAIKTIPLSLPQSKGNPTNKLPLVVVSVDQQGVVYWNQEKLSSANALLQKLQPNNNQIEVQLRGDRKVQYAPIAEVMRVLQVGGVKKIDFVILPQADN